MSQNEPNRPLEDGEIRRAIVDFSSPEEEAATISEEELDLYLADIGVDVKAQARRLHTAMGKADRQIKLAAAREQRLQQETKAEPTKTSSNWATRGAEAMRAEVTRRLEIPGNQSPQTAVYFRKLEDADEEDLLAMLEDLEELDGRTDNS